MQLDKDAMRTTAFNLLSKVIAAKQEERILLIYDETTGDIAEAFIDAAKAGNLDLTPRKIELTGHHAADPDPETVAMIPKFQILIAPTYYSLTHCAAFTNARKLGLHGATLPGITNDLFLHSFMDSTELKTNGKLLAKHLTGHHEIEIRSDVGTSLRFTVGRTSFNYETGHLDAPGKIGNIPYGEAYTAPDLGTMEGHLVVDGSIGSFNDWVPGAEYAVIEVKQGRAVNFQNDRAKALEKVLAKEGESAFAAAEFGIGTNPAMKITGKLLGDEKVKGTIHIAFGNNKSFGGENESTVHIDVMVLKPTLIVDEKTLILNGKWSI